MPGSIDPGAAHGIEEIRMAEPSVLPPLPDRFRTTVAAVHAVAEHVLCVVRHASTGRVGLVPTADGVGTVPFGSQDRVVAIAGDELVDRDNTGERRAPITTLRAAAAFYEVDPGVPGGLWTPVTTVDLDESLVVEPAAVHALAGWYAFVADALGGLAAAGASIAPLTLWPEGFDLATTTASANFGGSPGDGFSAEPYLYVGPFELDDRLRVTDASYWNSPFGASLGYGALGSTDQAIDFLVHGFRLIPT
jgi:hypothetical protein